MLMPLQVMVQQAPRRRSVLSTTAQLCVAFATAFMAAISFHQSSGTALNILSKGGFLVFSWFV
jgi:TRAP-type C4-dicarboxylate transport system permease small subunit